MGSRRELRLLKLSNVYDGVFRSELPLETAAKNHEARERLARLDRTEFRTPLEA